MNKYLTLFNTLKYLKPIQFTNRIRRKFTKIKPLVIDTKPLEATTFIQCNLSPSSYMGDAKFRFLNVEDSITNWNDETKAKLWLYNLHYFDDLNQHGSKERVDLHSDLIDSWIEQNPFMRGNGWEPYTISLRTVNWIKWFLAGNHPKQEWLNSLANQVNALQQQLEYHLLGNHLFANAKALVFAGCYFDGEYADKWLIEGLAILDKEVPEQILADGGNFELSPMYHHIILADMLDLLNLAQSYPSKIDNRFVCFWHSVIKKMLAWSEGMLHPDGDVAFFNDSAMGIAAKFSDLLAYANQLGVDYKSVNKPVNHLKNSGYLSVTKADYKCLIDVAKVGPDYIPGHAHADTLSFELSAFGQRLFVNSGTSEYGLGEERIRQRKTAAHNTVVVDGQDSSEVWSGFRVARRAYPTIPIIKDSAAVTTIECSHDGYRRLPGKITHTRTWQLSQDEILIRDCLSGQFNQAEAHYHLHPDVQVEAPDNNNQITLTLSNGISYSVSTKGATITVQNSTWQPEFGLSLANKKLALLFQQNEVSFVLTRVK